MVGQQGTLRPFGSRRSLWGVRRHLFAPAPSCRASLLSVFHPFPAVACLPAAPGLRPDRLRLAVLGTCGVPPGFGLWLLWTVARVRRLSLVGKVRLRYRKKDVNLYLCYRKKDVTKNHAASFGVMAGRSAGIKKPLREGAGREAGLQFLKRPGRPSDCLVRRRAAMPFDGHLAPVRGLPDVGLHRNNLLSRLSLGHRTHLLFALVASAFTATEQKLGRPGPFKNCNPLCLFTSPSRQPTPR